jgi:hypothetical protein
MQHGLAIAGTLVGSLAGWIALLCTAGAVVAGARYEFVAPADELAMLELRVTNAADSAPLAARIQIAPVGSFEVRPRRVIVAADGSHALQLAPGEYRVWASHGPEWSVAQRRVSLRSAERAVQAIQLKRQVQIDRYVGCDLHVHTGHSHDSQVGLEERLASAAAEGLQVAVITDHNHVTELAELPERADTTLVRGVEVTTWDPEFGHFNVFPSTRAPGYKHASAERLLAALPTKAARFIQVNHPRLLRHIGFFELAEASGARDVLHAMRPGFDGLEVWNGYDLHRPSERDRVLSDWLTLIRHGRTVVATGGSDSHDLARTVIGYPRTYVALPGPLSADGVTLAAGLRAGRAFVSNGPVLDLEVEGRRPGETLVLARAVRHVKARLRVDAPAWMDLKTVEFWLDGQRSLSLPLPAWTAPDKRPEQARAELQVELPVTQTWVKARSVIAIVRGERPMSELFDRRDVQPFAFTNPVWISRR